jgi:hypothetical protein
LHDVTAGLRGLCQLLKENSRLVFLEPNPLNPLYYLQILLTPEMTWAGERGMLRMRSTPMVQAMREVGLEQCETQYFGCLPPQIGNMHWGAMREGLCERIPFPGAIRPLILFKGQLPSS